MGSVPSVYIHTWFGLSIPQIDRALQHVIEATFVGLHLGQNIITSAVKNSVHTANFVGRQPLAYHFDGRNAPGHRCLIVQLAAVLFDQLGQLNTMYSDQSLVCRYDRFPKGQCLDDTVVGHATVAANQLNININVIACCQGNSVIFPGIGA